MAEDLRLFLQTAGGTVSPAAPAVPDELPPGSTLEAAPLPSTSRQSDSDQRPDQDRAEGAAILRRARRRLLPGIAPRTSGPGWTAREHPVLEEKDRADRSRHDVPGRADLRTLGLREVSLVKAGLLPRLGKHVLPVYVEATAEETEARLLKGLRKACPELPRGLGLVDSLANLRRGRILPPERKVLLVLDQFEQWLHAKRGEENTELVAALRHCDGEHVQAIVMVRDDFWLAASRFMRDLEIRLVEGENSALVDLFDPRHARKVLTAFGRAYGSVAREDGRSQQGPESLSGSSRFRACPGRQDHLGAAGPVRRDGEGKALDPGDAAGRWVAPRGGRDVPRRDLQCLDSPSRASLPPEGSPGGPQSPAARDRHRHQGADEIAAGIAGSIGLCRTAPGTSTT